MLDRAACERRVYRLATLLTGTPLVATRVITAVVDAQPDLRNLDDAHIDRLTVLRAREVRGGGMIVDPRVPVPVAQALADLPGQAREAWVLGHVYRLEPRALARAMDCSRTAALRHLDQAQAALTPAEEAANALRAYAATLEVPAFYRDARRRRRWRRLVVRICVALVAAAGCVVLAGWWWSRRAG
ncbi:MAG: hypothetical protein HKO59_10075 [Phycisphaerales bacterium]|nr:hypothetical protein [Phycisphaerales bacterium]